LKNKTDHKLTRETTQPVSHDVSCEAFAISRW